MSVLVGRSGDLTRLVSAVSAPPAVVVVEGEAGIGKTRLVTELQAQGELADRRFAVGLCRRVREPFPLGPVLEVARGLGESLVATSLSPVAGALRPLLPELDDRLPPRPEPLPDRLDERHRVFRGLVELLAAAGPAVAVLEDLHWADEQTIEFLGYLLDNPPPGLALVATFRGDEVDPRVPALAAKLPEPVRRVHAELASLDLAETGALAAAVLGVEGVSVEFAGQLWERTAGLPFAIEEVLALLRARDAGADAGGGWQHRALAELDVPTGIRDPVRERLGHLSGDARSVAEAAAVLQVPVAVNILTATCPLPRRRARPGLTEALAAGVLVEQPDGVGLRHLLAAQAVYEGVPSPLRQDLHVRAAAALRTLRPVPLGQLADHLHHAGQQEEWVAVAEQAADQAAELGHDTEAARLLEQVLREVPLGTERRGTLAIKLARAVSHTPSVTAEVVELAEGCLTPELPRSVRGELRCWLVGLYAMVGADAGVLHRLLAGVVDELPDRPDLQAWAMTAMAGVSAPGMPAGQRRRWLDRGLAMVVGLEDPDLRVLLLGKVAMVQVGLGDPDHREVLEQMAAHTDGAPHRRRELNGYFAVGSEACYVGNHELADRLLTAGLAGAVAGEHRRLELSTRCVRALLDWFQGAWDGLSVRTDALLSQVVDVRRFDELQVTAGCHALARGEPDLARDRLLAVLARLERCGAFDQVPIPAGALIRLALARGEVDEAVALARRVLATVDPAEPWVTVVRALPAVTEALVAAGEAPDAQALVDRLDRMLRDLDAPLAPAAFAHSRGLLAASAGRWPAAGAELLAAAESYRDRHCPYEAAQARELAARALAADARVGRSPPAAQLRAALATYERLGASWDAARARRTAREHGFPVPGPHRGGRRGYGNELSPRERRVAELAAGSRTNQEIADELFLSVKTVERHVTVAMRKLGVRSRHSIAPALATPRSPAG